VIIDISKSQFKYYLEIGNSENSYFKYGGMNLIIRIFNNRNYLFVSNWIIFLLIFNAVYFRCSFFIP